MQKLRDQNIRSGCCRACGRNESEEGISMSEWFNDNQNGKASEMQKLRDLVSVRGDIVTFVEETKVKKESIWVRQIVNDLNKY